MLNDPIRRPWWRNFRISLRALMILVLFAGGWLGWVVRSARVQRDAVASIEKAGGSVEYEWDFKKGRRISNGEPWWPKWLIRLVGVDYFGSVVAVHLINGGSDEQLAHVANLTRLEELQLVRAKITDDGLANLKRLTRLRHLIIQYANITDAGFAHLERLTALEVLLMHHSVHRCRIDAL